MGLTVHGAAYSVYSRILRLGLVEKSIAHDWVETDVFHDPSARAAQATRHPFSKIPSMNHDGFALYETRACLSYLEQDAFGPVRLWPADPMIRARAEQIAGIVDAYAYQALIWGVFVQRREDEADPDLLAEGLEKAGPILAALDALAVESTDEAYMAGAAPSIADIYLAPVFAYFTLTPDAAPLLAGCARLKTWWGAWRDRPSMRATRSPYEPVMEG